jgi:catalase
MNGYGSHTYSDATQAQRTYVKFHFKTAQGIRNFTDDEAAQMKANDMDFAQRDLLENIDAGNFPQWNLKIQVMTEEQANSRIIT